MTLRNSIQPEDRRGMLRRALDARGFVRVIEAHNGLSGILGNDVRVTLPDGAEREFDGLWQSSLTDTAAKGYPDADIIGFDYRFQTIQEVLNVTNKPIVVDGDTGGEASHFEYVCSRLERAGVSAVIIEDKLFPKRNSLDAGARQTLEDPAVFATKIRRGKAVVRSPDFLVIARLESLIAGLGVGDALRRARLYLEAGVDGIMIHGNSADPSGIFEFCEGYGRLCDALGGRRPLVSVPTSYNQVTEDELRARGVNVVIYANHLLRASYRAMDQVARIILQNGRSFEADPFCVPVSTIFDVVGFSEIREKDSAFAPKRPRAIVPAAGPPPEALRERFGDLPSGAIPVAGQSLLEHQREALRAAGIERTTVVTGFAADRLPAVPGVETVHNPDFGSTYILDSLFRAEDRMEDGFVLAYADVLFSDALVADLLRRRQDIVLVVDRSYRDHPKKASKPGIELVATRRNPAETPRTLASGGNEVRSIGTRLDPALASHEFAGIAWFSPEGARTLRRVYHDCRAADRGGPFHSAESFARASLTDVLQEIVDRGYSVSVLEVTEGWVEIRDAEDHATSLELIAAC